MRYRYKLLELQRQQLRYIKFLEVPPKPLTKEQKIKLYAEITRVEHHIKDIENMPFMNAYKMADDYTIEINSKLNDSNKITPKL